MPYLLTHSAVFTIILIVSGILQNRWYPNTFDFSFTMISGFIIALGALLSAKKNLNGPVILLLASFVIMIRNAVGIALDFQFFPYMIVATFAISQIVSVVSNIDNFKQIKK